jgi:AbiTii-like protein
MTTPLILQIQAAALDSTASVTDALRKAKVACVKLELKEFEEWIDLELSGYINKTVNEMPQYRMIRGMPEYWNPFHGWQTISVVASNEQKFFSTATINMTVPSIEDSVRGAKHDATFSFFYSAEVETALRESLPLKNIKLRIKFNVHQMYEFRMQLGQYY